MSEYLYTSAELSHCGAYRYSLGRIWREGGPSMLFVMLNPSTADADTDDPTIRRCIGFARREGCGALMVVNLFALRTSDPIALLKADDPVGPFNDYHIGRAVQLHARSGARIVLAHGRVHSRLHPRYRHVQIMLRNVETWCLGRTAAGYPRHPLYLRADAPLACYNWYSTPWCAQQDQPSRVLTAPPATAPPAQEPSRE